MKMTYKDLLYNYKVLYEDQPEEVKVLLQMGEQCKNDLGVQEVLEYLSEMEPQYITYTHN